MIYPLHYPVSVPIDEYSAQSIFLHPYLVNDVKNNRDKHTNIHTNQPLQDQESKVEKQEDEQPDFVGINVLYVTRQIQVPIPCAEDRCLKY